MKERTFVITFPLILIEHNMTQIAFDALNFHDQGAPKREASGGGCPSLPFGPQRRPPKSEK